jgi:hypothetical protein
MPEQWTEQSDIITPAPDMPVETAAATQRATSHVLVRLGRTVSSFPALITAVLIAKVYWTCRSNIADPDIWWQLRNAQYFFANLRFPNIDTYSFTAAGSPWVNHEWLSGLFYYAGFRVFGITGIFLVFASVLAVLVVAVFLLCLKEAKDPLAAGIAAIFGGLLASVGFTPRTQHFGWLCCVCIYAILLHFRSARRGPLWLIPVLFCVWANCHGTWLIGLIIYAIFVCAGLIRRDIGNLACAPWSNHELKRLLRIGCASVAMVFVNPLGYHLVLYPFDMMFRQKLGVGTVEEWASVNFGDDRGKLVAVVLAAVFAMALIGRKRWRIDDALLTAFVLYSGLTHMRFLFLAGIVLPPILASQFGRISSYDPTRERRMINSALLAGIFAVCAVAFPSTRMLNGEVADYFPVGAMQYLRANPQQGHMFNLYQWGGFLEWTLPDARTFIDSRTDIFEYKGILKDYLDVAKVSNSQEILDRYRVTYVLYPAGPGLPYFLSKSPQWKRIYDDRQAVVYRRTPN